MTIWGRLRLDSLGNAKEMPKMLWIPTPGADREVQPWSEVFNVVVMNVEFALVHFRAVCRLNYMC